MSHIMVDLETLSTRTNARILSIGAVKFNTAQGVYAEFYRAVYAPPIEQLRLFNTAGGFDVSHSTLEWWGGQSEEARKVFNDPDALFIDSALMAFTSWALHHDDKKDVKLWGNGASFDNAILSTAYALCGLEQPWAFWNDRCYRTVKNLHKDVPFLHTGTHHNALDDAISQACHLLEMTEIA